MIIMTIFMYTSYTRFSFSYTHPFYTYRYKPRTLSLSLPVISSSQFYFIVQQIIFCWEGDHVQGLQ